MQYITNFILNSKDVTSCYTGIFLQQVDLKSLKIYIMKNDGGNVTTSPVDPQITDAIRKVELTKTVCVIFFIIIYYALNKVRVHLDSLLISHFRPL